VFRAAVRVGAHDVEVARWHMLCCSPRGFEECDLDGGLVELATYLDERGVVLLRNTFGELEVTAVPEGWEDAWRSFHRPVVAGGVWIGPPWETRPSHVPAVVIDPGRAFGTGAHATTRLCLDLLARVEPGSLLDVGCGSGVLSIAAARLGFDPIVGIDNDPVAVHVARANAMANDVDVDLRVADAQEQLPRADVLVANVTIDVARGLAGRSNVRAAITAGYLATEAVTLPGLDVVERMELEGWTAELHRRQ
jgi:ribosomal protein L11 methyltransferase